MTGAYRAMAEQWVHVGRGWTEPHVAAPDLSRQYVQERTGATEARCLTCDTGEVVVRITGHVSGPVIESVVCDDGVLVHGQPVRVIGGRYHGRDALWQRFEWKRAGGNGHRRYHLVAVLPTRRGAGTETTCMAVASLLCPYCSVSLEAQCPTHASGDSGASS